MILVIGSRVDDVEYVQKKIIDAKIETIANRYEVYVGIYGGKEIACAATGYGQEMSAMITALLIERYRPYLVVNIGTVSSISPNLDQGDLFFADRIYAMDVDLLALGKYRYGQIPELPMFYTSDFETMQTIHALNGMNKNRRIVHGVLLSSNKFFNDLDEVKELIKTHFMKINNIVAVDTESAGMASACYLFDVPLVCFKACNYEVGNSHQLISRVRVGIEQTPDIGQLLTLLFNDFNNVSNGN